MTSFIMFWRTTLTKSELQSEDSTDPGDQQDSHTDPPHESQPPPQRTEELGAHALVFDAPQHRSGDGEEEHSTEPHESREHLERDGGEVDVSHGDSGVPSRTLTTAWRSRPGGYHRPSSLPWRHVAAGSPLQLLGQLHELRGPLTGELRDR